MVVNGQDYDPYPASDDEDLSSDTTSLHSEVLKYRFENGRRYHAFKDGAYWGPNDDKQNEQLDIACVKIFFLKTGRVEVDFEFSHHMFLLLLGGKLLLAPIDESVKRVLDIGTGTGLWAMQSRDFADEHRSAEIIGTDLSPIQPSFIPPNLRFEIDDATDTWTYPNNHFDLVHIRALYGSIADWPEFYRKILLHLAPGGWLDQLEMSIQFQSDDGSITDSHILSEWSRIFIRLGEKIGKTLRIAEMAKECMEDAGFTNVTEVKFKLPVGAWSSDKRMKELGQWNLLHCEQGIEGWALALLTRVLQWSADEVRALLAKMRVGLRDPSVHAYFNVVSVYGQKPCR
ncbi:hypothetical protein LOZ12_003403 [Ophidiomyces ophidiicola]|uniref:Uncharacterized protein n=1 Tax=Ophidiomyces ophidiicola TaxID=1387563 RepID=A0ACB8UV08_9EURO|nr:uncharacterized protein LOZ57_003985 [Ophidiomyces ophidiicola]KAI1914908.1 hypothetical protein LOZ64_003683 [Ophidiomyces ophidiicola]KAI1916683.1 hypothetical protein LOZ61_000953 [Ophidiomyces ophidiicola]KAI1945734.1 hypothetical protein LOZ57_003985 [Ophidiomyces ophidiicola]KAI1950652.1 hypothetical protein LOZ62_001917 [Ophidiomyces ophidiicola]KAI1964298.1 hypothetical protein LOZ59_001601 [Ophidiomyces ophidiicola]